MPKCVNCDKELTCGCRSPQPVGQVANGCTLKKGALWIHVTDDQGKDLTNVPVKNTTKNEEKTTKNGLAKWDPLDSKPYQTELGALGDLEKDYDPPKVKQRQGTVQDGAIAYIDYILTRKGHLKAKVVEEGGTGKLFEGATVTAVRTADTQTLGEKPKTLDTGIATFADKVSPGEYTVTAALSGTDATDYQPKGEGKATVPAGDEGLATVLVLKRAEAKITVPDPKIVLVARDFHGKDRLSVKPHRITVTLGFTGEFDGECELSCDKADHIRVYRDNDKKDLPLKLPAKDVKPGLPLSIEGVKNSAAVGDVELKLTLTGGTVAPKTATAVEKITCVKVQLDLYKPRPSDDKDPDLIPEAEKIDPGVTLYKQGAAWRSNRGKVRVTKVPVATPCELALKSAKTKFKLYETKLDENQFRGHHINQPTDTDDKKEKPLDLPFAIPPDKITDEAKGKTFWAEGAALTDPDPDDIILGVKDLAEVADYGSVKVLGHSLEIEVLVDGTGTLANPMTLKAQGPIESSGTIDPTDPSPLTGTGGKKTFNVEAGSYAPKFNLTGTDAEMRILRELPDNTAAKLEVIDGPTVKAKYVLKPAYKKVQFIGHLIETGKYIGRDDPTKLKPTEKSTKPRTNATEIKEADAEDREKALTLDIDGRCDMLRKVIAEAEGQSEVIKDADVLKIFMAPEFYFRGATGAYPFEMIAEIMPKLSDTSKGGITDDAKYKDWLFVLGSAIGARALGKDRKDHDGDVVSIVRTTRPVYYDGKNKPAETATQGCTLVVDDSGTITTHTVTAISDWDRHEQGPDTYSHCRVTVAGRLEVPSGATLAIRSTRMYDPIRRSDDKLVVLGFDSTSTGSAAVGWEFHQGSVQGEVLQATLQAGTLWALVVKVDLDAVITAAAAKLTDTGSSDHGGTVTVVDSTHLVIECDVGSNAENVAVGWKVRGSDSTGKWQTVPSCDHAIAHATDLGVTAPNHSFRLKFAGLATFDPGAGLAVWDNLPSPDFALSGVWPLTDAEIVFKGNNLTPPATPARGWAFEQGTVRGYVEAVSTGGPPNDFTVHIPSDKDVDPTQKFRVSDMGETEIYNLALVRKGGPGSPANADGSGFKEALVYKETISWVDFDSPERSRDIFWDPEGYMADLYDTKGKKLQSIRVLAMEGTDPGLDSTLTAGAANVPGQKAKNTKGVDQARDVSEVNKTGIGGGSVLTIDGVTYGLEVCRDHLVNRLQKYYASHAKSGEPKVQIQIIPSCGAYIDNHYCVPDGLIFNVDADKVDARKTPWGSGDTLTEKYNQDVTSTVATAADFFPAAGKIIIYDVQPMPTKGVV